MISFLSFCEQTDNLFCETSYKISIYTVLVLECNYSNKQEDIMKHAKNLYLPLLYL